jgi:hypothetical protein
MLSAIIELKSGTRLLSPLQVFEDEAGARRALQDFGAHLQASAQCAMASPFSHGGVVRYQPDPANKVTGFMSSIGIKSVAANLSPIETSGTIVQPRGGQVVKLQ